MRAYKADKPRSIGRKEAFAQARRPLEGFASLLDASSAADGFAKRSASWADRIAEHSCAISAKRDATMVDRGKGYDDPLESGIAFYCAVMFALEDFHAWGDGTDGVIVGPGNLPSTLVAPAV